GVILGARQLWLITAVHVTVLVNGQPVAVSTHRNTVEGAVRLAGVQIDDTVYLEPPANTALTESMVITLGSLRPVSVHADGQALGSAARKPLRASTPPRRLWGRHSPRRGTRCTRPMPSRPASKRRSAVPSK